MVGILLLSDVTEENPAVPADVHLTVNAGQNVGNFPRHLSGVGVPELE